MNSYDFDSDEGHAKLTNDLITSSTAPLSLPNNAQSTLAAGNQSSIPISSIAPHTLPISIPALLSLSPNCVRVAYMDASAIVKLLIKDGTQTSMTDVRRVHEHCLLRTTAICYAEVLRVLKRKCFFDNPPAITKDQYDGAVLELHCMINDNTLVVEPVQFNLQVIEQCELISNKYRNDFSDALQIVTVKITTNGVWDSTTILCTADAGLAQAAKLENIAVALLT